MVGRPPRPNPGTTIDRGPLWAVVLGALCMGGSFFIVLWLFLRALEVGMWR